MAAHLNLFGFLIGRKDEYKVILEILKLNMRAINDIINEAREIKYSVAFFLPDVDMADVPPFTVTVPAKYARAFEKFLENEEGNTVYHASDDSGDFEI